MAYLRDVTDRRRHEDEIRQLSRRLIQGSEDERKRLAADLHDEFGQSLSALHLGVRSLAGSLPRQLSEQQARCESLTNVIEALAENVRKISSDLRPDMLDHLGLIPTLEWYVRELAQRAPLDIKFEAVGFKRRLDPRVEIVLYRIMQEALNNVVKHAQADQVSIRLTYSHPTAIMVISDNGKGFDPSDPHPDIQRRQGIGPHQHARTGGLGGGLHRHSLRPRQGLHHTGGPARAAAPGKRANPGRPAPDLEGSLSQKVIKVLIADDHAIVREGIRQLVGAPGRHGSGGRGR